MIIVFAHTALTVEQQTRHPGTARLLDKLGESIKGAACARIADPIGCSDLTDAIFIAVEGAFPKRGGQVRQIERHDRLFGPQVSVGRSRGVLV
jgi:hypothetical protein